MVVRRGGLMLRVCRVIRTTGLLGHFQEEAFHRLCSRLISEGTNFDLVMIPRDHEGELTAAGHVPPHGNVFVYGVGVTRPVIRPCNTSARRQK